MKPHSTYDLIIIGAGISGLMALRHALKAKLNVLCLEKASDVGGLWRDLPDWQDLQIRKEDWAINGTPVQSEFRKDIHENIKTIVDKYSLRSHIQFQTQVQGLQHKNDDWTVLTKQGEFKAKNIIIATGLHHSPVTPEVQRNQSSITEYHSSNLFDPSVLANKKVTIVGGGSSAYDCLELALKHKAKEIHWVYRSTKWFIPHRGRMKYQVAGLRRLAWTQMLGFSTDQQNKMANQLLGFLYKKNGVEEIKPKNPFDYLSQQIIAGRPVFVKNFNSIHKHNGEIKKLEGTKVFLNHENFETDILLWGTGYKLDLSWTGLEAYKNLSTSSEIRKKLGSFFVSLDYPHLYFTGVSILDSNSTAPLLFSIITRSLISEIKGTCTLPRTPIHHFINHWDMIKFLSKHDRANYFPFFWKIKYFFKALYYFIFQNRQISI